MSKTFLSSGAFKRGDFNAIIAQARAWGIQAIELSSGLPYTEDVESKIAIHRSEFQFLIHNYFPAPEVPFVLNLASADEEMLGRSISHCRKALEISADIEAPFFAAHAGFAVQPKVAELGKPIAVDSIEPRDISYQRFGDSVKQLVEYGKSLGVSFLIENNVAASFNLVDGRNEFILLADPDELMRFHNDLGETNFGYLLDVAHLKVSAKSLGFNLDDAVEKIEDKICAFHLSENDGNVDSNDLFDEHAWFGKWVTRNPHAPATIEVYSATPEIGHNCLNIVDNWQSSVE